MDTARLRQLLDKRDAIDAEIQDAVNGGSPKKPIVCSACKAEGHTARTCTKKQNGTDIALPTV
jgi:hypothetical protein